MVSELAIGLAVVAGLVLYLASWWSAPERPPLVTYVGQTAYKLRKFVGPRLMDKNFQSLVAKAIGGALGISATDGSMQIIITLVTLYAVGVQAPWETLPDETLDGPRPA